MNNINIINKELNQIKPSGLFRGKNELCALCDDDDSNLTLVEHWDTEFYLCDEHLYLYLKLTNSDYYFSPASCTFG